MRNIADLTVSELTEIAGLMGGNGLWGAVSGNASIVREKFSLESDLTAKAITLVVGSERNPGLFLSTVAKELGSDFKFSQLNLNSLDTKSVELCGKIANFARTLCMRMREVENIKEAQANKAA